MPRAKEFTVAIADKPGELGKCFLALGSRGVNILAFQSYVEERESLVRFIADDMVSAQNVLAERHMNFEETDVAVVRLVHRPGALGRAAARLGEGQINIDYSYCGLEPGSQLVLLVFGVDSLTRAVALLDALAAEDQSDRGYVPYREAHVASAEGRLTANLRERINPSSTQNKNSC